MPTLAHPSTLPLPPFRTAPLFGVALPIYSRACCRYLEGGIDQCVPSLVLATLSTHWALVFQWRGETKIWLARGAPRRWYNASEGGFAVERVPTRFGSVSFAAATTAAGSAAANISFAPPPFSSRGGAGELLIVVRLRPLSPGQALSGASVDSVEPPGASVRLVDASAESETVTVSLGEMTALVSFTVRATFVVT